MTDSKQRVNAGAPFRFLVINGPNINLLGLREPSVYGSEDFQALLDLVLNTAEEEGFLLETFQSNHEGAIVDRIQDAYGSCDGIVINPAAYTHTSIAILDALKAVRIPFVEVHISAVENREDFRQVSFIRPYAAKTITGHGIQGYREALLFLQNLLAGQ